MELRVFLEPYTFNSKPTHTQLTHSLLTHSYPFNPLNLRAKKQTLYLVAFDRLRMTIMELRVF